MERRNENKMANENGTAERRNEKGTANKNWNGKIKIKTANKNGTAK